MVTDYIAGVAGGVAVTSPRGFYSGTIDCVKKTAQLEGIKGFYAGMWSPMAGQMIFRACSFASFYQALRILPVDVNKPTISEYCMAGALTGFCISFIETPIDLIKTKLQTQIFSLKQTPHIKRKYVDVTSAVKYLLRNHGVMSLWQGWAATALRNIPANAMFFPVNEIVKEKLAAREGITASELALPKKLVAGACAGLCYWTLTYPLDAIKGHMQSIPYSQRIGWLEAARRIYRDGGLRGFLRGMPPCVARSVPACAAMFATVDTVRGLLNNI